MSIAVVYVHGLWFSGREGLWLRGRLSRLLGAADCGFSYRSVTASITESARELERHVGRLAADTVHLVGHSLGGLVILKMFESDAPAARAAAFQPGRIVLLGPPLNGSRTAHRVARLPGGRRILGRGVEEELLRPRPRLWPGGRDLGIIAGDVPFGLGRLLGRVHGPSDGTVAVAETELEGATEHLVMRVSHSCLVFNPAVADQTAAFLRDGRFARPGNQRS